MKQTIMKNLQVLAILFAFLGITPALASEAPRSIALSNQEMALLNGQAGFYGTVFYFGSPASFATVSARQLNYPFGYYQTFTSWNGSYSLSVPNYNKYRTWASNFGSTSPCKDFSVTTNWVPVNHYIWGGFLCF